MAVIPGEDGSDITSTARNAALSLTYSGRRGEVRLSTGTSRMRVDNGGIGGINLPSTRQHLDTANANVRVTWRTVAAGRLVRGGATVVRDRLSSSAPSERPYEVVTGEITRGSNERSAEHRRSLAIHLKQVVDSASSRRPWNVGFEARRVGLDEARTMNPFGRLQSEAPGAPHGFWTVTRTPLAGTAVATTAAVFAEHTIVASSWARVRAGIRSDWQQGDGVAIAPRVSMTATRGRLQFTGGAGLFVQPWTADTFAEVTQRAGGLTYLIPGVNIEDVALRDPASGTLLTTRLDPRYSRRQDFVVRAALQRRTGPVTVGVEHTWTRGHRLTGAARTREAGAVSDVVRSDRDLRRHQTHARLQAAWRGHSLVGHYQFARSFDNSDGPFVQPASGDDGGTEWGPSRGIPRHAVQVAASLRLPARVRMAVTFDARVGVPFSAITGRDSEGLGTFMDRGGLPRNANRLPPTRGIGAHVSRRVHMKIGREFVVDLGARAENLTNHTNVTSVGRVLESSMFGRPLGTAPGRSVRLWATLGR
jgi:hypothetical protein